MSANTWAQVAAVTPPSPTDCILDAPDLTNFIATSISPEHGWTCGDNTTALAGSLSASPATLTLTGDDTRNCDRLTTAPIDAWYKFTAGPTVEAWLTFFGGDAGTNTSIALYKESVAPSGTCATVSGTLTFVDCSDAGAGGDRDVAECTMFEDKIDVSGLEGGSVYYVRIWERSANAAPAAAIDFYLCAERNAPIAPAVDKCEQLPHVTPTTHIGASVGCADSPPTGRDFTIKYTNQSNVGATGRDPSGFVDNNLLGQTCIESNKYTGNGMIAAGNTAGDLDYDCDGGTTIATGGNTVLNANVMYAIDFAPCDITNSAVKVTFDNMSVTPPGESVQVNVLGPIYNLQDDELCSNSSQHTVAFGVDPLVNSCVTFSNPGDVINRTFIIYVEGSNGALVKFDMEIDVDYEGCTDNPAPCESTLGGGTFPGGSDALALEWGAFEGRAEEMYNVIEWITLAEVENEYFEVLRSTDGRKFRKIDYVSGHGTTKEMKSYMYVDSNPLADAYYQLRTVSTSGEETYSDVIRINRQKEILDVNSVYPVPSKDKVRVDFTTKNAGTAQFMITDMYGKIVDEIAVSAIGGINTKTLDISKHSAGIYYLTVKYDGVQEIRKIVRK